MTIQVSPLRLGVIGLGPLWLKRYRPALLASRNRFAIRVLGDAVHQHATREAQRLGCDAAEGPTDLLHTRGLDAVLLLDRAWYGLWPLEQAARLQVPILCAQSLAADPEHASHALDVLGRVNARVMFAFPWRFSPATIRLRRLLRSRLGPVRLITSQLTSVCGAGHEGAIDWCLHLLQERPTRVQRVSCARQQSGPLTSLLVEFPNDRQVQLSLAIIPSGSNPPLRFQASVYAEHGAAEVSQPNRLTWRRNGLTSHEVLRSERTMEARLLRRFHQFVAGARADVPGVEAMRTAHSILTG